MGNPQKRLPLWRKELGDGVRLGRRRRGLEEVKGHGNIMKGSVALGALSFGMPFGYCMARRAGNMSL